MTKSKIEWCDYAVNPVKGLCPMACSYCYARRMYKRFKWNTEIRWDESCLEVIKTIKKPSKIFIGSTMELFGDWVGFNAINYILDYVKDYPQHTFIFLTKQPTYMARYIFPSNCWVGVSATDYPTFSEACNILYYLANVPVRFISFEPLLTLNGFGSDAIYTWLHQTLINWLIVGQQTPVSQKTAPKIKWIREIVEAADRARIPVFLKNNLEGLLGYPLPEWAEAQTSFVRQEFPHCPQGVVELGL